MKLWLSVKSQIEFEGDHREETVWTKSVNKQTNYGLKTIIEACTSLKQYNL